MDESSFSNLQQTFPDAEPLSCGGSTCDCYRIKQHGRLHFLKRLKPQLQTDPRYVAALHKEFEVGYLLEHPHLVSYLSCGDDYLLTEYVDGETLDGFIQSHPDYFKVRKNADRFLRQLLSVVDYLHRHQVIHLDLKPQNILITRINHDVKLTDLGFCYADAFADTMGRTDRYAAPEQYDRNATVDERTDIYAIGRLMEQLPCARIYNKVIARCTKTDKEERYQTVTDLMHDINKRHSRWLLGLVVVLLVVGLVVYGVQNRQQPVPNKQQSVKNEPPRPVVERMVTVAEPAYQATKNVTDEAKSEPKGAPAKASADTEHYRKELSSELRKVCQQTIGRHSNLRYQPEAFAEDVREFYERGETVRDRLIARYPQVSADEIWREYSAIMAELYNQVWNSLHDKETILDSLRAS